MVLNSFECWFGTQVSTDFGSGQPAFRSFADFDQLGFDAADKDEDAESAEDNGKHDYAKEEEEEEEEEEEVEQVEEEEGPKDPFAAFSMIGKAGKSKVDSPGFMDWGFKPTKSSNIGSADKSGFGAFESGEEADSKPAFNPSDSWSKF